MEVIANARGIPAAPFVQDVEAFTGGEYEATLAKFNEMVSKYNFMASHLSQRQASLRSKLPEIRGSLQMAEHLLTQGITADIEIEDTLWRTAVVPQPAAVGLWLGANVMLEYTVEDAIALLAEKELSARTALVQVDEDLVFLKQQITVMEVNMARVYNHDVRVRRAAGKQ